MANFVRGDEEFTVQVFGFNDDIGNSTETIWPTGGFINLAASGAAQTLTLTSAGGATDSGVVVHLEGLDGATWNRKEEDVTLGSDGTYTTTETWGRVNRAWVNSSTNLTGDCTIATTTSNTTLQILMKDQNTTGNASYTVPWGHTGYIDSISCNSSVSTVGVKLVISIMEYKTGVGFLTKDKSRVINFNGSYDRQFIKPVKVPQGSSIELQAICTAGTALSADFVVLIDKN
jgi:hypothetical protein